MPDSFAVPKAYEAFDDQGRINDPNSNLQLQKLVISTVSPENVIQDKLLLDFRYSQKKKSPLLKLRF
ncbi:MAG: hypothetical protein H0U49_06655 [Parachlamydiaceae bacterium]|nr:hypothetical protein [Parachlamydiaceae bacterium]